MQHKQSHNLISLKDISFETKPGFFLFKNLNLILGKEKSGLVGNNGIGKSTILKLIVGELEPSSGVVETKTKLAYLSQDYQINLEITVEQTLGTEEEHKSLEVLAHMGLKNIQLKRLMSSLSGGERMRVVLAKLIIQQGNFLILDEPTNNLDQDAWQSVYELIKQWKGGLLVVSHDRTLLNFMDKILELSDKGLGIYGGNFDFYVEQKNLEKEAAQRQLSEAEMEMKKTKKQAQATKERQQKKSSHGKKTADKLGLPKIILGAMKRRAQQTSGKLKKTQEDRIASAKGKLQKAKERISPENQIEVNLSNTEIPNGKLVAKFENVNFTYDNGPVLLSQFNLSIYGPERLAINGPNGSGKTTLVKLILGELQPLSGEVNLGINRYAYLDQNVSVLNKSKTVLENLKALSGLDEGQSRNWLARFLFPREDVFKKIEVLSGGERMRAALACILSGDAPPNLLVLDEPTNNLDLNSIERIESALLNFKGALIVISHDKSFLKNISIEKEITLEKQT